MTYFPAPQRVVHSVPVVRQQQVDWRALSDADQRAVRDYAEGVAPLSILSRQARVYVGRHHGARES